MKFNLKELLNEFDQRYLDAAEIVLEHEQGWSDDPDDPGGATKYGVSLRYLVGIKEIDPTDGYLLGDMDHDGDIDREDIRLMTVEEAVRIYYLQWWKRYGYWRIIYDPLAFKLFDLSVNMGPGRAHRLLQRALNSIWNFGLSVDGKLGPMTIGCCNGCSDPTEVLQRFKAEAIAFYKNLNKPKYIKGWIRRVLD